MALHQVSSHFSARAIKSQRDKMAAETNPLRCPHMNTCRILLHFPCKLLSASFEF